MSDMNIGGHSGIQQTTLDQGVNTPNKVGNLGGHTVTLAPNAQTPARGSGIGDKIARFFTSTLPKFFTSVGQSISNFFSKLTAPQTAPIEGAKVEAPPSQLQVFYDTLTKAIKPDTNEGTFLRGGESPNTNPNFKQEFKPFTQNWLNSWVQKLPEDKFVAYRMQNYEGGQEIYDSNPHVEGTFLSVSTFSQLGKPERAGESVQFIKDTWSELFGGNETEAKQKAQELPTEVKNFIATGFKAIENSNVPNDVKGKLTERFLSDIVLRNVNPEMNIFASKSNGDVKSSVIEISKIIQTIANKVDPHKGDKEPIHPSFLEALGNSHEPMYSNMIAMLTEAGRLGAPYTPNTGNNESLILTMDEVKDLTARSKTPNTN